MLICEARPGKCGHGSEKNEGRVEKDKAGLSNERVICNALVPVHICYTVPRTEHDQCSPHGSCGGSTTSSFEREEHGRNSQNTHYGRQKSHCDVRHAWFHVVFANVLEIEVAIESGQPTRQSDQELCEGRVNVHEELALDVLGRESTEAGEKVRCVHVWLRWERRTEPHRRQRCWAGRSYTGARQ